MQAAKNGEEPSRPPAAYTAPSGGQPNVASRRQISVYRPIATGWLTNLLESQPDPVARGLRSVDDPRPTLHLHGGQPLTRVRGEV